MGRNYLKIYHFWGQIRSDKEIQSGKMFLEWIVHFVIGDRPRDEFIIKEENIK